MNITEIASKAKVNKKTVYGANYLGRLLRQGFVRELGEGDETGGHNRYVFENVNSLTRDIHTEFYLAPGNVEYDEGFKNALKLIARTEVEAKFRMLLEFIRYIVESAKQTDEQHIAPKEDGDNVCSTCGLNHEARDFIRATLLYLLDQFERSPYYLDFLWERNYIDEKHYNEYGKFVEKNRGQQISEELVEKTKSTHSKINKEQVVAEAATSEVLMTEERITHPKTDDEREADYWFKKLKPIVKEMVEFLRKGKPEMSMWQIMNSVQELKNDHQLRSYPEAVYRVIGSFGISLPRPLFERYLYTKRKREEKRRLVAKRRKSVIDS